MRPQDVKVTSSISKDRQPMLRVFINDRPLIEFTVQDVPEANRDWLKGILQAQVIGVYADGYWQAQHDMRIARERYLEAIG